MRLLIDIGNTRIKYGVHDGLAWLFQRAFAHADGLTFELPAELKIASVTAVSVAGAELNSAVESLLSARGQRVQWFASTTAVGGLRNAYANPVQLGPDRWAAAIAAWQRVQGACIVVCAGTATTIDIVTADAQFRGGCIVPGLAMMRRALAGGTAALPFAEGHLVAIPDNTADAIFSGCLNAQLGAIARMRAQLPAAPIVLSGGAADALAHELDAPVVVAPGLVLEGLLAAA